MIVELLLSLIWLAIVTLSVKGAPEDLKDRESKMIYAFIFFGIIPLIVYWLNIRE